MLLGSIALAACSLLFADGQSSDLNVQSTVAGQRDSLVVGTVLFVNRQSSSITIRRIDLLGHKRARIVSYRLSDRSLEQDLLLGDRIIGTIRGEDPTLHVSKHSRANQAALK